MVFWFVEVKYIILWKVYADYNSVLYHSAWECVLHSVFAMWSASLGSSPLISICFILYHPFCSVRCRQVEIFFHWLTWMLIERELINLKNCQRKKHSNTENQVDEM